MGLVTLSGSLMYLLLLSATASPVGPSRASVCRSSAVSAEWEGSPRLVLALPWNRRHVGVVQLAVRHRVVGHEVVLVLVVRRRRRERRRD